MRFKSLNEVDVADGTVQLIDGMFKFPLTNISLALRK